MFGSSIRSRQLRTVTCFGDDIDLNETIGMLHAVFPGQGFSDYSWQGTPPTITGNSIASVADATPDSMNNYGRVQIGDRTKHAYKQHEVEIVVRKSTVSADGAKVVVFVEGIDSNLSRGNAVTRAAEILFSSGNVGTIRHFFNQTYINNGSPTYAQTNSTGISYSDGDSIIISVLNDYDVQTITLYEHDGSSYYTDSELGTTRPVRGAQIITDTYEDENGPQNYIAWSSSPGYFALSVTGNCTDMICDYHSVHIQKKKNLNLQYFCDSIGNLTRLTDRSQAYTFKNNSSRNFDVSGGTGCRTDDIIGILPCISLDIQESGILIWCDIQLGINDKVSGFTDSQIADNIETIYNTVTALSNVSGCTVGTPTAYNTDLTGAKNQIISKGFPYIVDCFTLSKSPDPDTTLNPIYRTDSIHPNELGHDEALLAPRVSLLPTIYQ